MSVTNKQVGLFKVGMKINEVLNICKKIPEHTSEFYFDDIFKNSIIAIKDRRLELIFDGNTQELISITGTLSAGLPFPLAIGNIETLDLRKALEIFPPTKKGIFHEHFYTLAWPEIHISFKVDEAKLKQLKDLSDHPLTADYAPVAERFWLTENGGAHKGGEGLTVNEKGVKFPSGKRLCIREHSAQDVLTELGEPDVHEGRFFRFYKAGIMLEISDRIDNIYVFSNIPTHPDSFGLYDRCPWTLEIAGHDKIDYRAPWKAIEAALGSCDAPVVLPGVQVFSYPKLGLNFEVSGNHVGVLHITNSF